MKKHSTRNITISDRLQDYLEYLVHHNHVQSLKDLTREERSKLAFLYLEEQDIYYKMIRDIGTLIHSEVGRFEKLAEKAYAANYL